MLLSKFQIFNNSNEVPLKQKVKVHICLENIDRHFISDVYYIFICSVWKLLFKTRPNVKKELIGQLLWINCCSKLSAAASSTAAVSTQLTECS